MKFFIGVCVLLKIMLVIFLWLIVCEIVVWCSWFFLLLKCLRCFGMVMVVLVVVGWLMVWFGKLFLNVCSVLFGIFWMMLRFLFWRLVYVVLVLV